MLDTSDRAHLEVFSHLFVPTPFPTNIPSYIEQDGHLILRFPAHAEDNHCAYVGEHKQIGCKGKLTWDIDVTTLTYRKSCFVCGIDPVMNNQTMQYKPLTVFPDRNCCALRNASDIIDHVLMRQNPGLTELFMLANATKFVVRPNNVAMDGPSLMVYCNKGGTSHQQEAATWTGDEHTADSLLHSYGNDFICGILSSITRVCNFKRQHDLHEEQQTRALKKGEIAVGEPSWFEVKGEPMPVAYQVNPASKKLHTLAFIWEKTLSCKKLNFNVRRWGTEARVFDANDYYVMFKSGAIVDLSRGEARMGCAEDYITRKTAVNPFVLNALDMSTKGGTKWQKFSFDLTHAEVKIVSTWFDEITMGNKDLREYMLIILGLGFTRITFDRKCYIFRGPGSDGKSTIAKLAKASVGQAYLTVPQNFFAKLANNKDSVEGASSAKMRFLGKTFAMVEESSMERQDGGKLKLFTGHDDVTGRELYGQATSFEQRAKIYVAANQPPRIVPLDTATMDRLIIILMLQRWTKEPKAGEKLADPVAHARLLECAAGFATLCLDAVMRHIARDDGNHVAGEFNNIQLPPIVSAATQAYFKEASVIYGFCVDCIDLESVDYVATSKVDMFQSFIHYSKQKTSDNIAESFTESAFVCEMTELGYRLHDSTGYGYYHRVAACGTYLRDFGNKSLRPHDMIMVPQAAASSSSSSSFSINGLHNLK